MHSLNDKQRELYAEAYRMAYSECASLMDSLVGLGYEAQAYNDDEVAQIATEGLNACRPVRDVLERMKAHLSLS